MSAGLRAKNLEQAIAELGLKPDSPMIEILAKQFEEQEENAPNAPAKKKYENVAKNLSQAKQAISPNAQQAMDYKQKFVAENKAYAEQAAKTLGISSKEVLAHTALESSWGRRQSGDFNLWGIKDPNGKSVATHEQGKDGLVATRANFKNYDSRAKAWQSYTEFLQKQRYASVQGDEGNFYQNLKNSGYATDNLYVSKLKTIENSSAIKNVAMAGGGMAIGAGIARAISNNSSTSIPSLKGVANSAKAVNDVAYKGGSKGFFNSISNGISKITGRDQQTIPSNKADDEKISRELPRGKDNDQLRKNVSTESFQQKVLYYLKRIDRNLEGGSGGTGKKTVLDSNGNVVGGGSLLGTVFGGLGKQLLGNAGQVAGSAVGTGIGSFVGQISSAILLALKSPMILPLAGIAVGASIIAHGVNRESDIRTEQDPEKKRLMIQEKNSNFWSRDITGLPKLQDMKDKDGNPLISQKTIDTSLPELAYKGWRRVSEDFDRGSNAILGGKGKDYLTTSTADMLKAIATSIIGAGTSFKASIDNSALGLVNSIHNAFNGLSNGAATIGQDLRDGAVGIGSGIKKWFTGDEKPVETPVQGKIPSKEVGDLDHGKSLKTLPIKGVVKQSETVRAIQKPIYSPTVRALDASSSLRESLEQKKEDARQQQAPVIIDNSKTNNIGGSSNHSDSVRIPAKNNDTSINLLKFMSNNGVNAGNLVGF